MGKIVRKSTSTVDLGGNEKILAINLGIRRTFWQSVVTSQVLNGSISVIIIIRLDTVNIIYKL